jgi:uncharacterized OB-fold protein
MKKCINCGDKTITPRSSYCKECFEGLLKEKIKEG